ncbi:MAG: transposase family protein [Spirochaetaceae bacterium]|jgi:hypothetical protein|nr:transposase family protein [Spirochaetaceae bacterium]
MAKKSAKGEEIRTLMKGLPADAIDSIGIEPLKELREQFESLKDARFQPFVERRLSDIVMITLIAVMAEADEWVEIGMFAKAKEAWLRTFLPLENEMPSHDAIQRALSRIDGAALTGRPPSGGRARRSCAVSWL